MATVSKSTVGLPTSVSATGTHMRDVSDTLRHLWPSNTIMAIVASGMVKDKEIQKKQLVGKRQVKQRLYECFTYTPMAVTVTLTGYTSETSMAVSSADGSVLRLKQLIVNTVNGAVYRVSANSSGTLTLTAVGAAASPISKVGDVFVVMAPAYGAGSSDPYIISKTEDQVTNTTQISRFPVAIDNTTKGSPDYLGDYFTRLKARNIVEGLRYMDVSAIFGRKAASTEVTTDGTLADTFSSTNGIWTTAASTKDCGGIFTHDFFISQMVLEMSDILRDPNLTLVMLGSQKLYGEMLKWVQNKLIVSEQGKMKQYGAITSLFLTSGPRIEFMVHDGFNRGDNYKKALIFKAEDYNYVYLRNRDLHPINGIQAPSADITEDDLLAEWGVEDKAGGQAALTLTNVLP